MQLNENERLDYVNDDIELIQCTLLTANSRFHANVHHSLVYISTYEHNSAYLRGAFRR